MSGIEIFMFINFIIVFGGFLFALFYERDKWQPAVFFGLMCVAILILFTITVTTRRVEEKTAIDALNGNNPYKREILYRVVDGEHVPADTLYIKIE